MGCCLDLFKKSEESSSDRGQTELTNNCEAGKCKAGKCGDGITVKKDSSRNTYSVTGSGTLLGSCSLDCDTGFWEVVIGKQPEGVKIGVKRCPSKSSPSLNDELDSKGDGDFPSWCLHGVSLNEGDVVGVFWDQTGNFYELLLLRYNNIEFQNRFTNA